MPWLFASPGHQHSWYWLCRISIWGRISTTCVMLIWRNDIKCKYMFLVPLKNLACEGLILVQFWLRETAQIWLKLDLLHRRNGIKFGSLMYPGCLQNWVDFSYGLWVFLILGQFWLRRPTVKIWPDTAMVDFVMIPTSCAPMHTSAQPRSEAIMSW